MSYSSETAEDAILWNNLTVSGIRLNNTNKTAQKFSTITAAFMIMCALHAAAMNLAALIATFHKTFFAYSILCLLSILLWQNLFRKRENISDLLRNIQRLKRVLNAPSKKHSAVIFATLSLLIFVVILVNIASLYLLEYVDTEQLYFTFSRKVQNRFLHYLLQIFGVISINMLVLYIPCVASLAFSVLEYRFSETLTSFNNQLELLLDRNATLTPNRLSKLHSILTDTSEELRDALSVPLLLLTSCNVIGFFIGMSNIILSFDTAPYIMETSVMSLSACSAILSQGIFGSLITEKLKTIRATAGKIVVKYHKTSFKDLYYFKGMEKKKIVCLTACDIFDLNRGFILHAFGAILTYSLLIINLN